MAPTTPEMEQFVAVTSYSAPVEIIDPWYPEIDGGVAGVLSWPSCYKIVNTPLQLARCKAELDHPVLTTQFVVGFYSRLSLQIQNRF